MANYPYDSGRQVFSEDELFEAFKNDTRLEKTLENSEKALRFNTGKLPLNLVPYEMLEGLAKVLGFGATKHGRDNWKGSLNTDDHESYRYDRLESAKRHVLEYDKGDRIDKESGLPTLLHAIASLTMVFWYDLYKKVGR